MNYQYKYTESSAFHKKCVAEAIDIAASKDIEATNTEGYPKLTINGKGFTNPMTFGKHKAELFINNIDKIRAFAEKNDPRESLILSAPGVSVELYLGCCGKILKYENTIREFIKNPGFLNKK